MTAETYGRSCDPNSGRGLLRTLDGIVYNADIVIVDTSILPTARTEIESEALTPKQARSLAHLCRKLHDILTLPKVRMHPKILDEMRGHIEQEVAYATKYLDQKKEEFAAYTSAARSLMTIPAAKPLAQGQASVSAELLSAMQFLETSLGIMGQKEGRYVLPDFENLSYALTLALTDPEKRHVLLARDTDFIKLFSVLIGLPLSPEFEPASERDNEIVKRLKMLKLAITRCEDKSQHQPYIIGETSSSVGSRFDWGKAMERGVRKDTRDFASSKIKYHLGMVIEKVEALTQQESQRNPTIDEAKLRGLYELVRLDDKDIPAAQQNGELKKALDAYSRIRQIAIDAKLHSLAAQIDADTQKINKYFSKQLAEIKITSKSVEELDKKGNLAEIVQRITGFKQTAEEYGMPLLANEAEQSLAAARIYARQKMQALTGEVERLRGQLKMREGELEAYGIISGTNGQLPEEPQPAKAPEDAQNTNGRIIYENICQLIGREPQEEEEIPKHVLIRAMGISNAAFANAVRRAEIEPASITIDKTIRRFKFRRQVIDRLGEVLTRAKPKSLS